ncbi:MAG: FemAB family XrtA/PEP-CTERM system-associated protein [Gemmatimonadaceae bacterium]
MRSDHGPDSGTTSAAAPVSVSRFDGPASEWDVFVRAQPGWTHFHLYGWRAVIERVFGHECVYLAARDTSGELLAVLPLVRVRSLIFGHYLVSMPFLNYGGPLGTEAGVVALADEAARLASQWRVKLLELRSRTPLPISLPVSHRKITVVRDLPADPDALWSSLPAKLRSQIKRPRKEGIEVRFGAEQIEPFYRVFAHHMRDLGTPVLSKRLFETLQSVFADDLHFAVAYHRDQPVAGGCGFLWNGEFEITWASALRSHSALSPNMLVYWELMDRMTRIGARLFNFGRCSPGSGTHRFKMQWGGREETLWWYQRAAGAGQGVEASTPSPDDGVFALATRVWQKLPVPIATRLGPSIVRSIP